MKPILVILISVLLSACGQEIAPMKGSEIGLVSLPETACLCPDKVTIPKDKCSYNSLMNTCECQLDPETTQGYIAVIHCTLGVPNG